ncbi:MAG: cytochrome c [Anaerolineae bacterium]|nr:cytochrome c [Anaerolineae bacterium]
MTLIGILILTVFVAACGTVNEPRYISDATSTVEAQIAQQEAQEEQAAIVANLPTSTPTLLPTATFTPTSIPTEIPPTATPTTPPTETPLPQPTEIGADDPLYPQIAAADAAHGETLFNNIIEGASLACVNCHYIDKEDMLVGPGQLNLLYRAGDRVDGQGPYTYMYNSIVHPNDYVVEGYPEGVMPQNFGELLSEQDLYDIVAYMATLKDH